MVAVSTISPAETMNFNNQRSAARQNLLASKAQNLYQRQLADMDFSRNLGDFNRQADQARNQIPTQFAQRGGLTNGLYLQALQRYAQDRISGLGNLQSQFQAGQGGRILQDRGFEDDYANALMQILGQQYARQAQVASGIGGFL